MKAQTHTFSRMSLAQSQYQWRIRHLPLKRLFDITFSILILTLGFPLFLIIAMAVKFTSKGNIFYSQIRIGRGGKPFLCYKYRTMYQDADERLQTILLKDTCKQKEWKNTRKLKQDPRITPIGNFLRRTSLDELPQFFNVLKGNLSIVGPRPVVEEEVENYFGVKSYKILSVRPGLTGIWQVSGRNNISYDQRIQLDETYVDTHNFWLDIKLILQTIPCMIFARGAY
jgi:exopolysaccharide production protein ExoY